MMRRFALRAGVFTILLGAAPLAVLAGSTVQRLARGRNYSDVGVAMYPHEGPAALLGVLISVGLCGAVLWAIQRVLPGCRGLVAWFGIPWLLVCNALFVLAIGLGF